MKVIICDDETNQREAIHVCFMVSATGYEVTEFELGGDLLDYLEKSDADLVMLDMGLPDIDGLDVLKQIRETSDVPVIVVSGNDTIQSVATALTIGADDYITKPFIPIELMARVEAVTRRTSGRISQRTTYSAPGILFDFDRKIATVDGNQVDLNLTEWDLLRSLTGVPGVVVEYAALKQNAWGNTEVSDAAVHMAIRRLRQKLGRDSQQNALIWAHRGIGYSVSASESNLAPPGSV